jgi:hypothetical protein
MSPLTPLRLGLIAAACCVAVLWLSGPAGALAAALALLLLGPGYLAQQWLWPGAPPSPLTRAALWAGLSLSLTALLYLWATTLGLALSRPALQALAAGVALAAGWRLWRAAAPRPGGASRRPKLADALAGAAMLALLGLTLWNRFVQIRGLALPVWVDSLHHALLIRVAAERGQAPLALAPYMPVEQLPYHWGYHVFSAALLQLSGAELPDLMLWGGQILGALIAPAAGALAAHLWRRPGAGLAAALVVGLVSIMPAYYLSWGRYTLLLGMLMLPATMVAAVETARAPSWRRALVCGLLLAGISLVHFIVFVFVLLWCAAVLLVYPPPGGWLRALLALAGAGALVALLTAPWLLLLARRAQPGTGMSATHVAGNSVYNAMPFELLWASNNLLLATLAGAGALLGLLCRRRAAAALPLWGLLSVVAANPVWLGLPYLSFVTNEMVAICMFLPLSALIGGGAAVLDDWVRDRLPPAAARAWPAAAGVALLAVALRSAGGFQSGVRAGRPRPPRAAIGWVARSTPPEARFLVNAAGWLGTVDRGEDGGWWLLPLAGRQVSTPPVIYTYGQAAYVRDVKRQTAWLRDGKEQAPEQIAAFMRANGYGYVYATASAHLLRPEPLLQSGLFEELFRQGQVSILRLR